MSLAIPPIAGTYLLCLSLEGTQTVIIGALGKRRMPAGIYAYCGSAGGPGGLAARVGRHLSAWRRSRWHVDYLRRIAHPLGAWVAPGLTAGECRWSQVLAQQTQAAAPVPGFGASDCHSGCAAHLVWFPKEDLDLVLAQWEGYLRSVSPGVELSWFTPGRF